MMSPFNNLVPKREGVREVEGDWIVVDKLARVVVEASALIVDPNTQTEETTIEVPNESPQGVFEEVHWMVNDLLTRVIESVDVLNSSFARKAIESSSAGDQIVEIPSKSPTTREDVKPSSETTSDFEVPRSLPHTTIREVDEHNNMIERIVEPTTVEAERTVEPEEGFIIESELDNSVRNKM